MSRNKSKDDKHPLFVPLFRETSESPAYRQLSFASRALFMALCGRCGKNSNGHVYLSQRNVGKELGHQNRNDIANWYRELVHYGFIVMTEAAALGVDGKGKAPHWRITDRPTRNGNGQLDAATKEFLRWDGVVFEPHVAPSRRWDARKVAALKKQNPGLHVGTPVDCTSVPEADCTSVPPKDESGTNGESISVHSGGTNGEPVTRLATGGAGSGPNERVAVADTNEAGRPKATRRQEPIVIDIHDSDNLTAGLGNVGDDELDEHGIIIEADGTFDWARDGDDPAGQMRA